MSLKAKLDKNNPLEYQKRSGIIGSSGLIVSGISTLIGFLVIPDGTNDITINIYDNVEASGYMVIPEMIIIGTEKYFAIDFSPGLIIENGIFFDISVAGGGSCSCQVYFDS